MAIAKDDQNQWGQTPLIIVGGSLVLAVTIQPNIALEPTPYSLRFAAAFGRSSPRVLAIMKWSFATTEENRTCLMNSTT